MLESLFILTPAHIPLSELYMKVPFKASTGMFLGYYCKFFKSITKLGINEKKYFRSIVIGEWKALCKFSLKQSSKKKLLWQSSKTCFSKKNSTERQQHF